MILTVPEFGRTAIATAMKTISSPIDLLESINFSIASSLTLAYDQPGTRGSNPISRRSKSFTA